MNISVFYLVQNLFLKENRTVSLNSHYLFVFKNPRDSAFVSHLARQLYPNDNKFLVESFRDATKKPFSFLLLDLKPTTNDRVRVIGNFLSPDNEPMVVYVPK